jgi:hypothetical protein
MTTLPSFPRPLILAGSSAAGGPAATTPERGRRRAQQDGRRFGRKAQAHA